VKKNNCESRKRKREKKDGCFVFPSVSSVPVVRKKDCPSQRHREKKEKKDEDFVFLCDFCACREKKSNFAKEAQSEKMYFPLFFLSFLSEAYHIAPATGCRCFICLVSTHILPLKWQWRPCRTPICLLCILNFIRK